MAFIPQNTSTFLLWYLCQKCDAVGNPSISVEDVIKDLTKCQETDKIFLYNFFKSNTIPDSMSEDIENLERHAWVIVHKDNPHIEMTPLGMFFARLHDAPPQILEALQSCIL